MKTKLQMEFDFDEHEELMLQVGARDLSCACWEFQNKLKWLGKEDANVDAVIDAWYECTENVRHLL